MIVQQANYRATDVTMYIWPYISVIGKYVSLAQGVFLSVDPFMQTSTLVPVTTPSAEKAGVAYINTGWTRIQVVHDPFTMLTLIRNMLFTISGSPHLSLCVLNWFNKSCDLTILVWFMQYSICDNWNTLPDDMPGGYLRIEVKSRMNRN